MNNPNVPLDQLSFKMNNSNSNTSFTLGEDKKIVIEYALLKKMNENIPFYKTAKALDISPYVLSEWGCIYKTQNRNWHKELLRTQYHYSFETVKNIVQRIRSKNKYLEIELKVEKSRNNNNENLQKIYKLEQEKVKIEEENKTLKTRIKELEEGLGYINKNVLNFGNWIMRSISSDTVVIP